MGCHQWLCVPAPSPLGVGLSPGSVLGAELLSRGSLSYQVRVGGFLGPEQEWKAVVCCWGLVCVLASGALLFPGTPSWLPPPMP